MRTVVHHPTHPVVPPSSAHDTADRDRTAVGVLAGLVALVTAVALGAASLDAPTASLAVPAWLLLLATATCCVAAGAAVVRPARVGVVTVGSATALLSGALGQAVLEGPGAATTLLALVAAVLAVLGHRLTAPSA